MPKKRVYDKDLGVELHLEEDDSTNEQQNDKSTRLKEPELKRKKVKLESSQSGSNSVPVVSDSNDFDKDSDSDNFDDIDYGDDEEDNENYINNQIGKYLMEENCCLDDETKDNREDSEHAGSGVDEEVDEDQSGDVDENEEDLDREQNSAQEKGATEKCRYWPNCNAGDSCSYHHPTKHCRTFPNCRFGSDCLYIHPICKYIPNCTRPGCPFAHPVKPQAPRPNFSIAPEQTSMPRCKYGFSCKNLMCKFQHNRPEPCRFGSNCLSANCPYTHPSDSVKKPANAFKWIANSS